MPTPRQVFAGFYSLGFFFFFFRFLLHFRLIIPSLVHFYLRSRSHSLGRSLVSTMIARTLAITTSDRQHDRFLVDPFVSLFVLSYVRELFRKLVRSFVRLRALPFIFSTCLVSSLARSLANQFVYCLAQFSSTSSFNLPRTRSFVISAGSLIHQLSFTLPWSFLPCQEWSLCLTASQPKAASWTCELG